MNKSMEQNSAAHNHVSMHSTVQHPWHIRMRAHTPTRHAATMPTAQQPWHIHMRARTPKRHAASMPTTQHTMFAGAVNCKQQQAPTIAERHAIR